MWSMGHEALNYLCSTTPYVCPAELRVHIRGPHGAMEHFARLILDSAWLICRVGLSSSVACCLVAHF